MSEWDPVEQKYYKKQKIQYMWDNGKEFDAVWMRNMEDNRKKQKSIGNDRDERNPMRISRRD